MRISLIAVFICLICPSLAHADKLKVVASFSILGDMVHQVAGDNVDIKVLVGPDSDTHTYEPTPADAKALKDANLVVVNGLGFEGWIGRLLMASGYTGKVVTATQGINALTLKETTLHEDPHAWQDLTNGRIYVVNIRDALMEADPTHASEYKANADAYIKQLATLDQTTREEIDKIPDNKRKIITTHDAFRYFAQAYHVRFIGASGINPEASPSAADLAHLIDQIREEHVQALFMENISDPRIIRQLESDSGAYVGGTLYSDALSPPDGPASTYVAMFSYNVTQLLQAMVHNQ